MYSYGDGPERAAVFYNDKCFIHGGGKPWRACLFLGGGAHLCEAGARAPVSLIRKAAALYLKKRVHPGPHESS